MKTKKQIIEETVEYICENGRAVTGYGQCLYRPDWDHPGCAFGRCMKDDVYKSSMEKMTISGIVSVDFGITEVDELLKAPYRGHPIEFWIELQDFHDGSMYWKKPWSEQLELTEHGKNRLKSLKQKWA